MENRELESYLDFVERTSDKQKSMFLRPVCGDLVKMSFRPISSKLNYAVPNVRKLPTT